MTRLRPHVTDHALIRYLERVQGVDVEAARRAVEEVVQPGVNAGASGIVTEGFRFCLSGQAVTTVKPVKSINLRTGGYFGARGSEERSQ